MRLQTSMLWELAVLRSVERSGPLSWCSRTNGHSIRVESAPEREKRTGLKAPGVVTTIIRGVWQTVCVQGADASRQIQETNNRFLRVICSARSFSFLRSSLTRLFCHLSGECSVGFPARMRACFGSKTPNPTFQDTKWLQGSCIDAF